MRNKTSFTLMKKKNCGKKNRIPLTKYEKNVYFKPGCHFYLWITIQNLVVASAGKENWPSHSHYW